MSLSDVAADLAPTGTLRVSINLGNPVLAHGTSDAPGGVSVDIAHEVADRLDLPLETVCFDAARKSFEALTNGQADLGFLAVEPDREAVIAFTAPYAVIEGVFAVRREASFAAPDDIDRPGVRVGVKRGSAYDLYLSRTLSEATIIRGDEGADVFLAESLDVAAGIRQPMTAFIERHPDLRLIEERFMEIRQAVGIAKSHRPETLEFLRGLVEELKASGFVEESLRRAGQTGVAVAPTAGTEPGWA